MHIGTPEAVVPILLAVKLGSGTGWGEHMQDANALGNALSSIDTNWRFQSRVRELVNEVASGKIAVSSRTACDFFAYVHTEDAFEALRKVWESTAGDVRLHALQLLATFENAIPSLGDEVQKHDWPALCVLLQQLPDPKVSGDRVHSLGCALLSAKWIPATDDQKALALICGDDRWSPACISPIAMSILLRPFIISHGPYHDKVRLTCVGILKNHECVAALPVLTQWFGSSQHFLSGFPVEEDAALLSLREWFIALLEADKFQMAELNILRNIKDINLIRGKMEERVSWDVDPTMQWFVEGHVELARVRDLAAERIQKMST